MLGKIYSSIFIMAILLALWYQKNYLKQSLVEFHAQALLNNSVIPVITSENYVSNEFKNGLFVSRFEGDNFTYFSDKKFSAKNNLIFEQNSMNSYMGNPNNFVLTSQEASGDFKSLDPTAQSVLFDKTQLQNIYFPSDVYFRTEGNHGQTSKALYSIANRTLKSENSFVVQGANGNIQGVGFEYDDKNGHLILNSHVKGVMLIH